MFLSPTETIKMECFKIFLNYWVQLEARYFFKVICKSDVCMQHSYEVEPAHGKSKLKLIIIIIKDSLQKWETQQSAFS